MLSTDKQVGKQTRTCLQARRVGGEFAAQERRVRGNVSANCSQPLRGPGVRQNRRVVRVRRSAALELAPTYGMGFGGGGVHFTP